MPLRHGFLAELALFFRRFWRPVKIRDFLNRAKFGLGMAMAIQAEGHAQWLVMVNLIHFVDWPVALNATDAAVHMNGMVEVDEIGDSMDLDPRYRLAAESTFPDQREPRVVS